VTGLLLAGVGHITDPPDAQKNFLVVDAKTERSLIESTFNRFTKECSDIGIVLINQHVRQKIYCSNLPSRPLIQNRLRNKYEILSIDFKRHFQLSLRFPAKTTLTTQRKTVYYDE
jgi:hypothetical protein